MHYCPMVLLTGLIDHKVCIMVRHLAIIYILNVPLYTEIILSDFHMGYRKTTSAADICLRLIDLCPRTKSKKITSP